jgi:hypothetical protein
LGDNQEQRLSSKNDLYSDRVLTRFKIFLSAWVDAMFFSKIEIRNFYLTATVARVEYSADEAKLSKPF